MAKDRGSFDSRFAAIMAMAGSAIGLGNIWRFPYMVGQNGGAAFILVYLFAALFLCVPIFISESIIGKRTQLSTFGAMEALAPGSKWKWMGFLTVITPLIILSYYSVVGGWSIEYLLKSLTFSFTSSDLGYEAHSSIFGSFISSAWGPLICHTVFMIGNALVVIAGVRGGIEKFTKFTTPLLFLLIVLTMVYSVTLPGASEGVRYMVKPDFSKLSTSSVLSAMGQAFFSLSLGVGTILTYASYLKHDENLLATGAFTSLSDLLFALLAGFAVMPAVFAAGIEPGAGPGLIFEALPFIFTKMGASAPVISSIVAILFFLTILCAALTSSISMLEVGVAYLVDQKNVSRKKATIILALACWLVGAFCSLSFGPLQDVQIFGRTIFDFCDHLTSDFLMTFGSLLFVIFVGWRMKKSEVYSEFTNDGSSRTSVRLFGVVYFFIRFVAPAVILLIFFSNLLMK